MPSTTAILESATNNVSSSVEFANSFCRSSDNCSLADNSSSCSDLSTDSGAVVYNTGTSETTSVKSCASVDQSPDSRRLSLDDGDDSSSQSFPDDHFTNSGASSPAGVCYQCEVDSTSAAVTSLSQQQQHNQQPQQQSISQRANQDEPAHLHRHTLPSHLLTNYHPHLHHQHHSHSEDVTRSVQSLKAETASATHHHPHPYPHQHPNPQQFQKSQNGVYDNATNSANSNNNKFNRYSRRNAGQGKKPRHYSNSFVTQAGYYPCNICCYSYSPLFEIGNQTRHQPGGNSRLYRNRSYSASQTQQQQQHSDGAVLTLAECPYLYSNYRKRSSLYNLTGDEEDHILNIGQRSFDLRDVRYDVLTFDQVRCLNSVLDQTVKIKSDLHMEVVEFSLMNLILAVKKRLLEKEIVLYDIRLNGGAASHVLSLSSSVYNDIDLIFFVDLKNNDQFERVREAVLEVLLEFIPATISEKRRIIETFVNKMVKVSEIDRWSLISLCNYGGRNVELKFVDSMRRQYEFSVDSFQVVLDTLLQFCSINSESNPMTYNFYPTVVGESMFGNFSEAMFHLHHRLIVTKKPEEIRGGGLLKYCNLLVRKFYPIDEKSVELNEPYMCTRFFIDFFYYECQRDKLKNYLTTHFGNDTLLKYNFMIIFFAVIRRSSSVASHHASAMLDFEKLTMDLYSVLLTEYLTLYLTNYSKVQEFFARCQEMRACQCPKYLRSCIHRYLNPVYSITSPIVVTYVDDAMVDNVPKDERKKNLAKFIDLHDELFPHGGFSFAFFPSTLFDRHESNHYVVSSSTLKNLPSSRFVRPEPPSADYLYTFLMKPTNNGQQQMIQIIPLGIQDLLPKSFHAINYSNPNLVSPALAFHFFPPIAPPHAYRFCIVNRIPIRYSETIASGPIYNSQVISMHYPQPQAPAPPPPQQQQQTQSAHSTLNSVTTALGVKESPQQVNLSQFPLPPVYPHHHLHNPFHHHHHHHAPQQQQPQLPSHHNSNLHFNYPHHHHHHSHAHQHPTHAAPGSLPIYSPVPYFPHYLPSPGSQTSPPRSKKSLATATSANQQSQQSPVCEQIPPLIEPLRIVYPRLTQMESVVAQPAKPAEIANGEHSWTERFSDTGAVTTQQLDNVDIGSTTSTTNTAAKQSQQSEQTQKLPFPIPQIAINGNATNGYAADSGTQVKRSFAATTKAYIHNQSQQSRTNNATATTAKMSINSKKHLLPQTVTPSASAPVTTANSNKSQNGTVLRKGAPSISSKKKGCAVSE